MFRYSHAISIHAPHAGCDRGIGRLAAAIRYFNPRTPCGVRHSSGIPTDDASTVFQSTHPMRGATNASISGTTCVRIFQSTHPMRGATMRHRKSTKKDYISIHAPHAGCDSKTRQNHHVPLHKTYIVYQIFISLALYLLMFFKQKIKIAQNSGAKSCVLL